MSARWARLWFAATALCVAAGVAISIYTAVQTPGRFHSGVERAFNTFAFFTVQSNLIVGATTLLLAVKLDRSSTVFRTFRLIGLVAITITGIVYHVALARLLDLEGWHQLGDQLVHTVVPVLAVVGWLMFGPRRLTSARIAWLSVLFPFCWIAFTLVRGAVIDWYPYPFIDVTKLGYGKVILNCFWISLLLFGLAAGATAIDQRLGRGATDPEHARLSNAPH
ncbi:MAG TPA: Pr6Pr family membrane protein [Streptosporangiaceae bacterium]